jgi:hypothetical protein
MRGGKGEFLKRLTASAPIRSIEVGKKLEGTTPPSVFIGSWNYPKVFAGPMITPVHGDTMLMDTPETWIPSGMSQEEIIGCRMNLVRGKREVKVTETRGRFVETLQEIALSSASVESEVGFTSVPHGVAFSDDHAPYGPSAGIDRFEIGNVRWDRELERVFHDPDLSAAQAVVGLHRQGVPFSRIQKAFSAGTMGLGRSRRLVPTRWSITACDSAIGDSLLRKVRSNQVIDTFRVHEFSSLNNYYAVLLLPTIWQYEWMEAFLRLLGQEEMIFSDSETGSGKKEYSRVGGCYYSCKMAVLESLAREERQAGAIVFREAYRGYIPLGVFNVRENVRSAMSEAGREFEDLGLALGFVSSRLTLPIARFAEESTLFRELGKSRQTRLTSFLEPGRDPGTRPMPPGSQAPAVSGP